MAGVGLPIEIITKKAFKATTLAVKSVKAAIRSLDRDAKIMERDMKRRAPVAFGPLRSHIGTVGPERTGTRVSFAVGVRGINYARFVEFGTGRAGAQSTHSELARQAMEDLGYEHGVNDFLPPVKEIRKWLRRKGLDVDLAYVVARAIGRRGLKAQPFVYPAFAARREKILPNMKDAVAKELGI